MMTKAFDRIKAGLDDALAWVRGDDTRARLYTPDELAAYRKQIAEDIEAWKAAVRARGVKQHPRIAAMRKQK